MGCYYSPERMDEAEVKSAFVARQPLLDEATSRLASLAITAANEHLLFLGDRGMGKTTLLLMLRLALREALPAHTWFPVRFPEEPYSINSLEDFWEETTSHLAYASSDPALAPHAHDADSAAASIRDWCRRHRRRLVLLIDNLDRYLLQIPAPKDRVRLAEMLSRDGAFTVVGTATAESGVLRDFTSALQQPLNTWRLEPLDDAQSEELLRRRAWLEGRSDFEERLKQNRARLNVLRHFTGGNPRHTLMLYRIFTHAEAVDVRRGLDWLLDEITPYYQGKTDALPPQQRKILDVLARVGGRTGEALTPTRIAQETRLPANQISAQLNRLANLGYVRVANLPGRNSYYSVAEPLYAVWRQTRFGREGCLHVDCLVEFLKRWYANRESGEPAGLLAGRLRELLRQGQPDLNKSIEFKRYLAAAMDRAFRSSMIDRSVRGQLLSALFLTHNWQEVVSVLESMKNQPQITPCLWALRGLAFHKLGRHREALQDYDRFLAIVPNHEAALERADVLVDLRQYHRAIESCEEALRNSPHSLEALGLRALCLAFTGRFDEAIGGAQLVAAESPGVAAFLQVVLRLREIARQPASLLRYLLGVGAFDEARVVWRQLLASESNHATMAALAAQAMSPATLDFLDSVTPHEASDDAFLYLRRALEFVRVPDRAALGKLAADTRPIVEEILSHAACPQATGPA